MDNIEMCIEKIYKGLGKNIKKARLEKGLSQTELAEKMGKTHFTLISAYENGRGNPSLKTLIKMAIILDKDIDFLVFGNKKQFETDEDVLTELNRYIDEKNPKGLLSFIKLMTTERR